MIIENKDDVKNFMNIEENYQMENYEDVMPEFDVADFSKYDQKKGKMPFLRFHSHMT